LLHERMRSQRRFVRYTGGFSGGALQRAKKLRAAGQKGVGVLIVFEARPRDELLEQHTHSVLSQFGMIHEES
jgi:hypothetical protein